ADGRGAGGGHAAGDRARARGLGHGRRWLRHLAGLACGPARPHRVAEVRVMRALSDTLRGAARSLGANKLRSALTLLGIVIGVLAVVAMAATTEGLRRKINEDLEQLGSGVFQVQKWPVGFGPRDQAKYERRSPLTLPEVALLSERCRECQRVAGEAWAFGQKASTETRETRGNTQATGGTVSFFDNNGYTVAT